MIDLGRNVCSQHNRWHAVIDGVPQSNILVGNLSSTCGLFCVNIWCETMSCHIEVTTNGTSVNFDGRF